jgi:DNA-binding CsgD family transcriptional regulator
MRHLPAGLTATDPGAEFYATAPVSENGKLIGAFQGRIISSFYNFPDHIVRAVSLRFQHDPDAHKTFPDDMPLKDKIEEYALCNLGGFDRIPDWNKDGNVKFEYWDCGMRGKCPHEGKRCKPEVLVKNHITPAEVRVIQLLAQGYSAKMIAGALGIAKTTVDKHERNIHVKLNFQCRSQVVAWAIKHNIV